MYCLVEELVQVRLLVFVSVFSSTKLTSFLSFSQLFGEEDQLGEDSVSPDTADPEASGKYIQPYIVLVVSTFLCYKSTREC